MPKLTKLKSQQQLDPGSYVNSDTGEILNSEHPEAIIKVNKSSTLVDIKYEEFTITNDAAMRVIRDHYTHPEVSRIAQMTTMVNDCTNILKRDGDVPHSTESLMETLGYNRGVFYIFIRKLIWHDIVNVWIKKVDRKIVKTIVLNPYLARRSKTQIQLAKAFTDISGGLDTIVLEELPKFPTKVNQLKSK